MERQNLLNRNTRGIIWEYTLFKKHPSNYQDMVKSGQGIPTFHWRHPLPLSETLVNGGYGDAKIAREIIEQRLGILRLRVATLRDVFAPDRSRCQFLGSLCHGSRIKIYPFEVGIAASLDQAQDMQRAMQA